MWTEGLKVWLWRWSVIKLWWKKKLFGNFYTSIFNFGFIIKYHFCKASLNFAKKAKYSWLELHDSKTSCIGFWLTKHDGVWICACHCKLNMCFQNQTKPIKIKPEIVHAGYGLTCKGGEPWNWSKVSTNSLWTEVNWNQLELRLKHKNSCLSFKPTSQMEFTLR